MRLTFFTDKLLKAKSKKGLVAVKKQVTKNGKTFVQTFYVKPDNSKSKKPSKPVPVEDSKQFDKPHWNASGGFFIQSHDKLVKIPEKYIESSINIKGKTFIIHRGISNLDKDPNQYTIASTYVATELNTGLAAVGISEESETISGIRATLYNKLEAYSEEGLDNLIKKGTTGFNTKLSSGAVFTNTDNLKEEHLPKYLTIEEIQEYSDSLYAKYKLELTENDEAVNEVSKEDFRKWINDLIVKDTDKAVLEKDIHSNPTVGGYYLRLAVNYDINMEEAQELFSIANEVKSATEQYGFNITRKKAFDWVATNELYDSSWDINDYDIYYDDKYGGGIFEEGSQIIAGAVAYGLPPEDAKEEGMDRLLDAQNDMDEENDAISLENFEMKDAYGKWWDGKDLRRLGKWVYGTDVKEKRGLAKSVFQQRREGLDYSALYEDSTFETIEKQSSEIKDTLVYRGTGNVAWLDAEVGTAVPLGIASFTKSIDVTKKFSSEVTIIIGEPAYEERVSTTYGEPVPIIGVDVDSLIKTGREKDMGPQLRQTGVDEYADEHEVIVVAPSVEIVRVNKDTGIVWVKPVEMDLIKVMKSLFSNKDGFIELLERTFDQAMREDTEELWS
jgi:hypothetical protein